MAATTFPTSKCQIPQLKTDSNTIHNFNMLTDWIDIIKPLSISMRRMPLQSDLEESRELKKHTNENTKIFNSRIYKAYMCLP